METGEYGGQSPQDIRGRKTSSEVELMETRSLTLPAPLVTRRKTSSEVELMETAIRGETPLDLIAVVARLLLKSN